MRLASQPPGHERLNKRQCRVCHRGPGFAHYPPLPAEGVPAHRPRLRAGHPPQDLPSDLLPLPLCATYSENRVHIFV